MHEIAAASRLSLSSSFMQRARESTFIANMKLPRYHFTYIKKASLSKDRLGLWGVVVYRTSRYVYPSRSSANILPHTPTANLSCPIFFFAWFPWFLIFWRSIRKNYVTHSREELWLSSLPSCTFILFMQRLYSYVSFYCFLCENGPLCESKFSNEY